MTNIYHYHPTTGEYIASGEADPDPLDAGNWLIPAYATTEEPPTVAVKKAAVFTGSKWEVKDDFRGKVYWLVSGEKFTVKSIGEVVPDGALESEPLPDTAPESVPAAVTMRQARLALHSAGLLTAVEAAIDALPEPPKTTARIEWDYASEVHRTSPFVALLGASLGLDDQGLDDLFFAASIL